MIRNRFQNGQSKTGLDQLVRSKVKSSLMVEIRPTGWSGLTDRTCQDWSDQARQVIGYARPLTELASRFAFRYFYHYRLRSNEMFLK